MKYKYVVEPNDLIDLRVALDILIHKLQNKKDNLLTKRDLEDLIELEKRTNYRNLQIVEN